MNVSVELAEPLGVGTIGRRHTLFEINPEVIRIARDRRYFVSDWSKHLDVIRVNEDAARCGTSISVPEG